LAPFGLAAKNNNALGEEYKIDPQLIKKAEDLLGKASLDNTDLTITSLNFIDEQQQQQQHQWTQVAGVLQADAVAQGGAEGTTCLVLAS